ncbi:MAG: translation initiation factor IF-2 [Prevotellaceae bacterium]|jgi:translation initiation factor IF-2|nr:translation initiation factor IF-2 [Prevotellaceae bacterium]
MARLVQVMKTLNIGLDTAVDFLEKKKMPIAKDPNVKLSEQQEALLTSEFSKDKTMKEKSEQLTKQRQEKPKLTTIAVPDYEDESKAEVKKIEVRKLEEDKKLEEVKNVEVKKLEEDKTLDEVKKSEDKKLDGDKKLEEIGKTEDKKTEIKKLEEDKKLEEVKIPVVKEVKKEENKKQEFKNKEKQKPQEKQEQKQEQKPEPKPQPVEPVVVPEKKEPEIFKYGVNESRFAKKVAFKPTGEKIDLSKVANETQRRPLSKEERKAKYREQDRQKREAERIAKQQLQREQHKNQTQEQKKEQRKREEEIRRRRQEERDRQQQKKLKNPVLAPEFVKEKKEVFMPTVAPTLKGVNVKGKIELPVEGKPESHGEGNGNKKKKKRKRIGSERVEVVLDKSINLDNKPPQSSGKNKTKSHHHKKNVVSNEDVTQNIKETLSKFSEGKKANKKAAKLRREKRDAISERISEQHNFEQEQSKILKITEFITANELAQMMNVSVNEVIKTYMNLGMFVGINQRLDAETINIVAEEFDFETEFVSAEASKTIEDEDTDKPEDLLPRSPIVTVMGHVDHGKTSLLDYIRKTNVIAGEAGGITQHIGAYNVTLESGQHITFLDTPGHAAFTAMRARGAKVTDIVIIIVAADDIAPGNKLMPQTIEAINHATSANVPIVFAINKIDKDGADPEKIKTALSEMNFLVESWGGKYQSQDISAKKGIGVAELLDKVLLEAELLELKANPSRKAVGSVIELTKDKGRGNVVTLLVETGTLKQGDIVVAGYAYGKIRAMFNERNQQIKEAKPSEPVLILGMKGELQAGDRFNVMETEQKAREIVSQRDQLKREQKLRTSHHLTLEEIGRRIALGSFQELNVIVKGDVDGSIEALSDSLIKLSTPEIQVNVIHKGVGEINESDINLAISSDAIVVGFQVRPSATARKLADAEHVDIRIYSIIYQAIEEVKSAMEGMLQPEKSEKVTATLEVREAFHISKVGTIAGCFVKDGKIRRNSKVRLIRDGIVICTSEIESLKHEKDDVKEVNSGYECGLNIANFNDIQAGDIIEAYEEIETKKKLE